MKLNEKIAWYRRERKLSQEELAAQVGVSRQAVSKWELGEAAPDVTRLLALARAFGVSADHLLDDGEGPERPGTKEAPVPPPPQERVQPGGGLTGLIGRMVRRWGWLAGIYISLQGAGVTLVGALARWGFSGMFQTSSQMMGGFGTVGGWSFDGPPELERDIMEALGITPQVSPLSGFESFALGFATVILVIGLIMVIGGLALAFVLWKKGKKGE